MEYPRLCGYQIENGKQMCDDMVHDKDLSHTRAHEHGSNIMEAMETNNPI